MLAGKHVVWDLGLPAASSFANDTGAMMYRCADVLCRLLAALLVPRSSFLCVFSVPSTPLSSCPEVARLSPARNHTAAWFELLWCLLTALPVPRFLASSRRCLCSGVLFSGSPGCVRSLLAYSGLRSHARAIWAFELIMRLCSCGAPCAADLVLCFSCADFWCRYCSTELLTALPVPLPSFLVCLTGAYALALITIICVADRL